LRKTTPERIRWQSKGMGVVLLLLHLNDGEESTDNQSTRFTVGY